MSEQQDKNIEQVAEEIAASSEVTQAMNKADSDVAPARAATPAPAPGRISSVVAWLALLMVLAVAGGLAWFVWEQQRVAAGVGQRLQQLEAAAASEAPALKDSDIDARLSAGLDQLNSRWQGQLETGLAELKSGMGELGSESSELGQTLQTLQSQLAQQRVELARIGATDREAWVVAEAEYLLRLANQRLVMARDAVAAEALLSNVDKILLELNDPGLHDVRAAVAADLAAVRAVPTVDVEGIYLRLSALVEQAGQLKIFQLQAEEQQLEQDPAQEPAPAPAEGWQGRLQTGYEAALVKLSDYLIIRRRDVPIQALMDPQWEGLVRQNLRMLLEQAQVALLSGNQTLYRESLRRAQHWVDEFFESDGAAARAMSTEIGQLVDLDIAASVPAISRSIQALDDAMQQRLQQGGEE